MASYQDERDYGRAAVVKKMNDTEIRITSDGRFLAKIKGTLVRRKTLADIERSVTDAAVAVPAMRIPRVDTHHYLEVRHCQVIAVESSGVIRLADRSIIHRGDSYPVFIYDAVIFREAEAVLAEAEAETRRHHQAMREVEAKMEAVKAKAKPVTAESLKQAKQPAKAVKPVFKSRFARRHVGRREGK